MLLEYLRGTPPDAQHYNAAVSLDVLIAAKLIGGARLVTDAKIPYTNLTWFLCLCQTKRFCHSDPLVRAGRTEKLPSLSLSRPTPVVHFARAEPMIFKETK